MTKEIKWALNEGENEKESLTEWRQKLNSENAGKKIRLTKQIRLKRLSNDRKTERQTVNIQMVFVKVTCDVHQSWYNDCDVRDYF